MNLRAVVTGPLSQKFSVTHPVSNDWSAGTAGDNQGVIAPASKDEAKFLPEGTRLSQSISVYAAKRFGFGDLVSWLNNNYKIVHYQDFSDYGYHYCLAVRTDEPSNPDQSGFIDV
ncbi:MAG TPA: hypothetical protein VGN40_21390 [Lelliottia sp.]|jgi:hypothetical protein